MLISGSNGFIGSSLVSFLESGGHEVVRLVRSPQRARTAAFAYYNADSGEFNRRDFEGMDAVIHLAGHGIMRRWTSSAKKTIEESRVASTEFLSAVFSRVENPPKVFLCASATGFYGNRGDECLGEESGSGDGFLARLAEKWENAANSVSSPGTRVVNLRFGVVLAKDGGALGMILLPFKLGLGGTIADGSGYMSWISRRDAVRAVEFILCNEVVSGPVNIVSPTPVRNRDFVSALARVLGRPVFLSLKEFFIKFIFGQMGGEVILSSARVFPKKLLEAGFRFEHEDIEDFLCLELGEQTLEKP